MVDYIIDYYAFLKVKPDADKKTIKRAYNRAMRNFDSRKKYSKRTQKKYEIIKEAYIILTDDEQRRKFDKVYFSIKTDNKPAKKDNKIGDTVKFAKDMEDEYGVFSKLFKTAINAFKTQPLMATSNVIIGGAVAGYGIKRGRDYMAQRGKKKNQE